VKAQPCVYCNTAVSHIHVQPYIAAPRSAPMPSLPRCLLVLSATTAVAQHERLACPLYSRIVQHGDERSASTFQWYLLCSIQRACVLEANLTIPVICDRLEARRFVSRRQQQPFLHVAKTHLWKEPYNSSYGAGLLPEQSREDVPDGNASSPGAVVFISQKMDDKAAGYVRTETTLPSGWGHIVYRQRYSQFIRDGLAVLHHVYRPMFGLSERATLWIHRHVKLWQVLRTCCGSQQSVQHRAVLHGLSGNKQAYHQESYDDPDCDIYDLQGLETAFLSTRLSRAYPNELYLADGRPDERIVRGVCATWEKKIRQGFDFSGKAKFMPPPSPRPPPRGLSPPSPPHPPPHPHPPSRRWPRSARHRPDFDPSAASPPPA
jgi:hypothetical protein